MEKMSIEVRERGISYGTPGKLIKTISRKPWFETIGNFQPLFCRYNGGRYLVESESGDISDPFRRDETYLSTLFIQV